MAPPTPASGLPHSGTPPQSVPDVPTAGFVEPLDPARETFLIGPDCRELVVSRDRVPQLASRGFIWVGHGTVLPPYRMVRPCTQYSHLVASVAGCGRILVDGALVDWPPNQVMISPRGSSHAFEAAGPDPWKLAWVFYDDRSGDPLIPGDGTRLIEADCTPFSQLLHLLTREVSGEGDSATIQHLVSLLHTHTQRLAGETRSDTRLTRLWHQVESNLSGDWNVDTLAKKAHLSPEQLRRLCHRFHRKSPMAHVRDLRMHYASMLLASSVCTVEEVAFRAGFASLYSFSAAFKRWTGVSPAHYRSRPPARPAPASIP